MNGSNHLEEADARPLHLCPVHLRKLQWSIGFDATARYRHLVEFDAGTPGTPGTPSTGEIHPGSNMAFAWGIGGGVDVSVNERFAVRLFQADYINTRTDGFSGKPANNARVSGGFVFRFGYK